ncbi:MAG: polysaccharide biosynthesis C-terminal domain-containing protein, partial [Deltaproteobacteria bacterium]|nr:polysaccharide biosynthesis C-terminal domain-containing protein [Deltaproteobacteria bacterium]
MPHQYKDLTQGPIQQQLLRLSAPMFFGIFAVFFFGVTDAYFLGKLGASELAAMGFVLPVLALFMSFSRGMSEAAVSLVSRKLGAQDTGDAKLFSTSILTFSLLLALIFAAGGYLFKDDALTFLGATGRVKSMASDYLTIWFAGMIFLVIPMVGNGFIRAAGDTRWPAMVMVFAAIGNILLDPVFIFGLGPAPELGMKGAAVASILSRSFTLLASLYLVHYKYHLIGFSAWQWGKVFQIW